LKASYEMLVFAPVDWVVISTMENRNPAAKES
jgi:hypothetical protein